MTLAMNAAQMMAFLEAEFPQALRMGFTLQSVTPEALVMRQPAGEGELRPGRTISGPTLMTVADSAAYLRLLSVLGPVKLAVTTHLSIDFLRRPLPGAVIGTASILKLGKRLAVVRVDMVSEGDEDGGLVASAAVTYSLPPTGSKT